MQIWPAIDIRDGNCVRLTQGDYSQETVYGSDPADMAHRWAMDGASGLHVVDLDAARNGSPVVNRDQIRNIIESVEIPCQIGGGIRNEQIIEELLELGAARLVIGTKAITDPQWLGEMSHRYEDRLVVAIDARDGLVATEGWEKTSDVSCVELVASLSNYPLAGIIFTDISRDGMLAGPNIEAMKEMVQSSRIPLIASGGVTTVNDIAQLAPLGLSGCIVGRSLYEGRITLLDAMNAARSAPANS